MPCDTKMSPGQTLAQRKTEVRDSIAKLASALAAGRIKPVVGQQGAIAFQGWNEEDRARVTDVCAFRMLMSSTSVSAMAKMAIQRAEMLAGRGVDKQIVAQGGHYHGDVYHEHKG